MNWNTKVCATCSKSWTANEGRLAPEELEILVVWPKEYKKCPTCGDTLTMILYHRQPDFAEKDAAGKQKHEESAYVPGQPYFRLD